jgi:hypothetical protein
MSDTDACLWHPWLRINRAMREMARLGTRRSGGVGVWKSRARACNSELNEHLPASHAAPLFVPQHHCGCKLRPSNGHDPAVSNYWGSDWHAKRKHDEAHRPSRNPVKGYSSWANRERPNGRSARPISRGRKPPTRGYRPSAVAPVGTVMDLRAADVERQGAEVGAVQGWRDAEGQDPCQSARCPPHPSREHGPGRQRKELDPRTARVDVPDASGPDRPSRTLL